jgi:steroid delta-isomerase-like uncharacterized protein
MTANNKAIVVRFIEKVLNKADYAAAVELLDSGFALNMAGLPQPLRGIDALKNVNEHFRSGFPDRRITVADIIADGDKVAARVVQEGTHTGQFQNIAPTGKRVNVSAIAFFRLVDGKIVEEWLNTDRLGLLQQLGAFPPPNP